MRVCIHVCVFAYVVLQCAGARAAAYNTLPAYPYAWRDESIVDYYHGTQIKDPYRWLEDPFFSQTEQFIIEQNHLTDYYVLPCLANLSSFIARSIPKEVAGRTTNLPIRAGHRYFFSNEGVWYVQDSLHGKERVFLDPKTLSANGSFEISKMAFSPDGSILAYGLSETHSRSDMLTVYFKNVHTGLNYPDILRNVSLNNLAWTKDNKGLFYSLKIVPDISTQRFRYQSFPSLNYHLLHTSQAEDVIVMRNPRLPIWTMNAIVTDGGQYLLVDLFGYAHYGLYVVPIGNTADIKPVSFAIRAPLWRTWLPRTLEYVTTLDLSSVSIFRSNISAPNYQLLAIDLNNSSQKYWTVLVPEKPSMKIISASAVDNDKLVLHYSRDVKNVLQLHDMKTGAFLSEIPLDVGKVGELSSKKDQSEMFIKLWTFFTPIIIYHMDFKSPPPYRLKVYDNRTLKDIDISLYETKQIFYSGKNYTRLPMYIISKKGLPRNGSNPTLLYGYGGYNDITEPFYNRLWFMFVHNLQGVFAIANIRGGGEYGEAWHQAGIRHNKQNSLDDFQAAASYLIREKYTRPDLLTIQGSSNGGLLVAACITQRPELFGAAIVQSGVTDMLRYHKMSPRSEEFGTSNYREDFNDLIKYSPLHNVRPLSEGRAQYPATLVLAGALDNTAKPAHSLKFIAALQHAVRGSNQTRPLLARVYNDVGHITATKDFGDVFCFIIRALKLNPDTLN